jgi:hypothetical protein
LVLRITDWRQAPLRRELGPRSAVDAAASGQASDGTDHLRALKDPRPAFWFSCGSEGSPRDPGNSHSPFLIFPVPVYGLSAILSGIGDHVAEPERKNDDGGNPKNVDGKANEASQEGDRE